jgi:hypothetical protein
MFVRWKEDNKNWSQRLKDLFSGDLDDTAKVLEKVVEKAFGGEATGGGTVGGKALGAGLAGTVLGGNVTYHALLGAGACLAF